MATEMTMPLIQRWRRRRLSRPWTLLIAGLAFLLIPVVNYVALTMHHGLPLIAWQAALGRLHPYAIFLLAAPLPIGVGLLLVKRWAWYAFLVYSMLLLLHNLATLLLQPDGYNFAALFGAGLGIALLVFFARQDISAPYLKTYPRGWRFQRRKPVETAVRINDTPLRTRDLSVTGFYSDWPDCPLGANQSVRVALTIGDRTVEMEGGVVRLDENGVGIAFRRASEEQKALLSQFLQDR